MEALKQVPVTSDQSGDADKQNEQVSSRRTPRSLQMPHPIKTLIVDDDASMRQLLEVTLRSRGHKVTPCADAETAWTAYQRENYPLY